MIVRLEPIIPMPILLLRPSNQLGIEKQNQQTFEKRDEAAFLVIVSIKDLLFFC